MTRWIWVEIFPGVWEPVEVVAIAADNEPIVAAAGEDRWTVDASELPY